MRKAETQNLNEMLEEAKRINLVVVQKNDGTYTMMTEQSAHATGNGPWIITKK